MGAGVIVRAYRTKEIDRVNDGLTVLPWTAPLFLLSVLALSAFPPFGIFRSEFQIVAGGLGNGHHAAAAVLVGLVTVAFLGLAIAVTRMMCAPGPTPTKHGEPSAWMVAPMTVGLVALVVLGVHPPGALTDLLVQGAADLTASSR